MTYIEVFEWLNKANSAIAELRKVEDPNKPDYGLRCAIFTLGQLAVVNYKILSPIDKKLCDSLLHFDPNNLEKQLLLLAPPQ